MRVFFRTGAVAKARRSLVRSKFQNDGIDLSNRCATCALRKKEKKIRKRCERYR